jgi:glutamate-5-semialdehyde dehydrogenase
VVAVIFESRPDALPQISALCLKSGNAVILKGGKEAKQTNRQLFRCMQEGCVKAGLPPECLILLESRQAVETLLQADRYIDLVVPRGSNDLVRHIQNSTRIPVLGHADGLCHLYVDKTADVDKAVAVAVDSKVQYPAACNAIETLLVHEDIARQFLEQLLPRLIEHGVELRLDDAALDVISDDGRGKIRRASDTDWSSEYCDLILSVKLVPSIERAIEHINQFGSHHTDAIVSEDESAFDLFFKQVDSAGVFWNASTRFADGFRYGFGAEVGISTGKLHPRGPVGLDGLVTYKYKVAGNGHIVADYVGGKAKQFSHKPLGEGEHA